MKLHCTLESLTKTDDGANIEIHRTVYSVRELVADAPAVADQLSTKPPPREPFAAAGAKCGCCYCSYCVHSSRSGLRCEIETYLASPPPINRVVFDAEDPAIAEATSAELVPCPALAALTPCQHTAV